jgi:hypothetical protein
MSLWWVSHFFIVKLGVIMLSANMLSVIMLSVTMLSVIKLSVIMLSAIMLGVIMPNVVMLNVIMPNVVMLNVVAPVKQPDAASTVATCTFLSSKMPSTLNKLDHSIEYFEENGLAYSGPE